MKSEEISDVLTKEGIQKLKVGQILMFKFEGSRNEYQITRLNRKSGKCWVKPVRTYHPDEVQTEDIFGDKEAFNLEELNG
jgi:hypothetical protein